MLEGRAHLMPNTMRPTKRDMMLKDRLHSFNNTKHTAQSRIQIAFVLLTPQQTRDKQPQSFASILVTSLRALQRAD